MSHKKIFGGRNKDLSESLLEGKIYYDWVVTTAFYSAIHIVEDKLLPVKISNIECECIGDVRKAYGMNGRHESRERLVFDKMDSKLAVRYKWLDDRSRYSRYTTYKIQPAEGLKAKEYLTYIFKDVYSVEDDKKETV